MVRGPTDIGGGAAGAQGCLQVGSPARVAGKSIYTYTGDWENVTHLQEYFNLFLEDAKYITGDPYGEPSSWKYEVVDEYNIAEMRGALLYCEMLKDGNTTCDYRFLDHNDLWNTNHAKVIKEKGGEDYFTFMLSHPKWYDL
eukprot:COSAG01_NODE_9615_length_2389_cov_2.774236_2_plen_141_part_00